MIDIDYLEKLAKFITPSQFSALKNAAKTKGKAVASGVYKKYVPEEERMFKDFVKSNDDKLNRIGRINKFKAEARERNAQRTYDNYIAERDNKIHKELTNR